MTTYTQEEALEKLWSAKGSFVTDRHGLPVFENGTPKANPNWCKVFLYASLRVDVEMGDGPKRRLVPEGTTVLVTMASRFGDVGIRADRLVPPSHGYDARVIPEWLTNWRDAP